jgi:hypothetical protein
VLGDRRAGARGGGYVEIPAGTYQFTNFTVPQGVVLRGIGPRCHHAAIDLVAGNVIDRRRRARRLLSRLTLDGVTLVGNSVGVYARNKDQIVFDDVEVKRFETGVFREGGSGVATGASSTSQLRQRRQGYGVIDDTGGSELNFNEWTGGLVETCARSASAQARRQPPAQHNTCGSASTPTPARPADRRRARPPARLLVRRTTTTT